HHGDKDRHACFHLPPPRFESCFQIRCVRQMHLVCQRSRLSKVFPIGWQPHRHGGLDVGGMPIALPGAGGGISPSAVVRAGRRRDFFDARTCPMSTANKKKMVTAVFRDRYNAELAFEALRGRAYRDNEINVLMSELTRATYYSEKEHGKMSSGSKAGEGAAVGGAVGTAVGAGIAAVLAIGTTVA